MNIDSDDKSKSRRHVHLYDEDWDLLQELYGDRSANRIGASEAVRKIVHQKCMGLRRKLADAKDSESESEGAVESALRSPKGMVEL